jgi:hypothetical protein
MTSVNIYYKYTAASKIEKYPFTILLLTLPVYLDESCTIEYGSLTSNSTLISSSSLFEVQSSLSLNNGLSILYSYVRDDIKSVTPSITYQNDSVGIIKSLERNYISDELRVLILTF